MGNASSGGFDIGEKIEYNENKWTVNAGLRKEGEKEAVTIFSFAKKQNADRLIPAQRCIQKAKTLKHPFIVSYIESAEYDESLVLVTEQCKPLEAWLSENTTKKSAEELVWGFRCVLDALQFLHNNGLTHGYLGLHAIFVTKGGDMKLGALDLVANMTVEDDLAFLRTYVHLLNKPYLSPERQVKKKKKKKHLSTIITLLILTYPITNTSSYTPHHAPCCTTGFMSQWRSGRK